MSTASFESRIVAAALCAPTCNEAEPDRSIPVRWFTPHSGHIVNGLSGANGLGPGSI
jgi:hypothetical protein